MGLLDRVSRQQTGHSRYSVDDWVTDLAAVNYGGTAYFGGLRGYGGDGIQQVSNTLPAYMAQLRQVPPAFAAQMLRAFVLSQARFVFRNRRNTGQPRKLYGTTALAPLENPWQNGTTGDLLSRMEWMAGLTGNAFVVRRSERGKTRLRLLNSDWVGVLYGSELEPDDPIDALDNQVLAYFYRQGGISGGWGKLQQIDAVDVAHWTPLPDPEIPGRGMSWLTPGIRDMSADRAATVHKEMYFKNAATPNIVVNGIPAQTRLQFDEMVAAIEENHAGSHNAFKTLYLTSGADARVLGANLKDIDFHAVQGSGETRISVLSRVPASLLGISEGLQGSSLNAGNFAAARRAFADTWVYPALRDVAAALSPIVDVPNDSELWFDTTDIPLLREDGKDAAEIASTESQVIRNLVDAGYEPGSITSALRARDWSLLVHTGLYSVQLQPAGGSDSGASGGGTGAASGSGSASSAAVVKQRDVAETLQKVYLAVGNTITADEARDIANKAGANLPVPGPFPIEPPQDAGGNNEQD